jgi:hypothetical protein
MKVLDKLILVLFVVGLVVLCFFQQCRMDIYFLVLGFAIAAMSLVSMIFPNHANEDETT